MIHKKYNYLCWTQEVGFSGQLRNMFYMGSSSTCTISWVKLNSISALEQPARFVYVCVHSHIHIEWRQIQK